jgi:ferrous iron transport protein B
MIPKPQFYGSVEQALAHIEEAVQGSFRRNSKGGMPSNCLNATKSYEKRFPPSRILDHIESESELRTGNDDDAESIITDERYRYITSHIDTCCERKNKQQFSHPTALIAS